MGLSAHNRTLAPHKLSRGTPRPVAPRKETVKAAVTQELNDDSGEHQTTPRPPVVPLWMLLSAAAALIIGVFVITQTRQSGKEVAAALSTKALADSTFHTSIAAPGLVEAASGTRNLAFDVGGRIKAVFVEEGQAVKAGQVLAQLDNAELAARVEAARAERSIAEARQKIVEGNLAAELIRAQKECERLRAELAVLENGPRTEQLEAARAATTVAQAEANLAVDERKRYFDPAGRYENWSKNLFDQAARRDEAAIGRLAAARAQLAELEAGARAEERDKARALLAGATAEYERVKTTSPFQLAAASAAVTQARANVAMLEAELSRTVLTSPLDGTVVWKFMHAGEAVDGIQHPTVLSVANLAQLRVRCSVDEADYMRIKRGQLARVKATAFPGQSFNGCVDRVGTSAGEKPFLTGEARERRDVRVIETLVTLPPNVPFKLGLRVTVHFESQNGK